MTFKQPSILIILVCALVSCKKKSSEPPPDLQNATVTMLEPADSSFFDTGTGISFKAQIQGSGDKSQLIAVLKILGSVEQSFPASITKEGLIEARVPAGTAPGKYRVEFSVSNPYNTSQVVNSNGISVFIGIPPANVITSLTKDDTSITINWSKSEIHNFQAYEVYVTRTDTMLDRPPYPDGKLLARITDQNILSYKHDSIYFFYKYNYLVKVVTAEDLSVASERQEIIAGSYLQLPANYATNRAIYDSKRHKMYLPGDYLKIVDPAQLVIEDSVQLSTETGSYHYSTLNPSGNSIDYILTSDQKNFQLASLDLDTRQVSLYEQFTLPEINNFVLAYLDKHVIYGKSIATQPTVFGWVAQNVVSGNVEVLTTQFSYHAEEISDNRLMLGTTLDSIYVLKLSNGVFSLQHKIRAPGYGYFNVMGVSESANYISVSRMLFDQSFVPKFELEFVGGDNPNFFIGLSDDGAFAATFHNQVISISTMQEIRRYGDGFGSVTYFSPDNNVMYHFTEGDLNIRWNPPPRLFRYPWR